jgi:hypothetical protein
MLHNLLKRLRQVRTEIRETWEATVQLRQMQQVAAVPSQTWVPPGHYYSPIVDPAELERRRSRVFDRAQCPSGIDLHKEEQNLLSSAWRVLTVGRSAFRSLYRFFEHALSFCQRVPHPRSSSDRVVS